MAYQKVVKSHYQKFSPQSVKMSSYRPTSLSDLSKMFDVGDLPVLTFGNWVLKAEWLSGLWNYMYVFHFFSKSKKHDFLRFFELLHTFSPTVPVKHRSTLAHLFYDDIHTETIGYMSDRKRKTIYDKDAIIINSSYLLRRYLKKYSIQL